MMNSHIHKSGKRESGSALIISLILLAAMTIAGLSAMNNSLVQERLTGNFQSGIKAMQNAETGIADAITAIEASGNAANALLSAGSDYLVETAGTNDIYYSIDIIDNDDGDGDFTTDTDNIMIIKSTGTLDNASRVVQVYFNIGGAPWTPSHAILTEESLKINSDTDIYGANRDVHSNHSLDIGDEAFDAGHISTDGTIYGKKTATDSYDESTPDAYIPDIIPGDFKGRATHILKSNGKIDVLSSFGTVIDTHNSGWDGWEYSGGTWEMKDDNPSKAGIFYAEGNIVVGANPGEGSNPDWNVSLIAEGSIQISGNPEIITYDDGEPGGKILLLAGGDIKLNGNSTTAVEGLIAARAQIQISGNPIIEGFILSQGIDGAGENYVDENEISGNVTLTYNNSASPFAGETANLTKLSWQQIIE